MNRQQRQRLLCRLKLQIRALEATLHTLEHEIEEVVHNKILGWSHVQRQIRSLVAPVDRLRIAYDNLRKLERRPKIL